VTGLNIAHMIENGGIYTYKELADTRAEMLYDYIDNSGGFYVNHIDTRFRSTINVPFRINPADEDASTYTSFELKFLEIAAEHGLVQLKGHGSNPGIRVSMYNAMPVEGVEKLIEMMAEFKKQNDSPRFRNPEDVAKRATHPYETL
jgi:phosphoserine aminotransferase